MTARCVYVWWGGVVSFSSLLCLSRSQTHSHPFVLNCVVFSRAWRIFNKCLHERHMRHRLHRRARTHTHTHTHTLSLSLSLSLSASGSLSCCHCSQTTHFRACIETSNVTDMVRRTSQIRGLCFPAWWGQQTNHAQVHINPTTGKLHSTAGSCC